jgi:hypothetical protein
LTGRESMTSAKGRSSCLKVLVLNSMLISLTKLLRYISGYFLRISLHLFLNTVVIDNYLTGSICKQDLDIASSLIYVSGYIIIGADDSKSIKIYDYKIGC